MHDALGFGKNKLQFDGNDAIHITVKILPNLKHQCQKKKKLEKNLRFEWVQCRGENVRLLIGCSVQALPQSPIWGLPGPLPQPHWWTSVLFPPNPCASSPQVETIWHLSGRIQRGFQVLSAHRYCAQHFPNLTLDSILRLVGGEFRRLPVASGDVNCLPAIPSYHFYRIFLFLFFLSFISFKCKSLSKGFSCSSEQAESSLCG